MSEKNKLYYGDNLDVLRRYVKVETADLVYLDPPFSELERIGYGDPARRKRLSDWFQAH